MFSISWTSSWQNDKRSVSHPVGQPGIFLAAMNCAFEFPEPLIANP